MRGAYRNEISNQIAYALTDHTLTVAGLLRLPGHPLFGGTPGLPALTGAELHFGGRYKPNPDTNITVDYGRHDGDDNGLAFEGQASPSPRASASSRSYSTGITTDLEQAQIEPRAPASVTPDRPRKTNTATGLPVHQRHRLLRPAERHLPPEALLRLPGLPTGPRQLRRVASTTTTGPRSPAHRPSSAPASSRPAPTNSTYASISPGSTTWRRTPTASIVTLQYGITNSTETDYWSATPTASSRPPCRLTAALNPTASPRNPERQHPLHLHGPERRPRRDRLLTTARFEHTGTYTPSNYPPALGSYTTTSF